MICSQCSLQPLSDLQSWTYDSCDYFICAGASVKTHAQSSADGKLEAETEAESSARSAEVEIQPPDYETVLLQQKQEERERERGQPPPKAVAFDVALSSDGQFMAKKPPPRRLEVGRAGYLERKVPFMQ